MTFLFSIIVVAWLITVFFKVVYYLYLWQIKEYRVLRLWSSLQEPGGLSLVFTKLFWGSLVLGVLAFLLEVPTFFYLAFVYYIFVCLVSLAKIVRGRQAFPAPSLKVVLLSLLSFGLPVIALTFIPFVSLYDALLYMVVLDLLTFFLVSGIVLLFKPLTYAFKQRIVAKAQTKRRQYKLTSIGIAGSVGKTSTKEFLSHILGAQFRVVKTKEHQNTEIGSARAILSMKKGTQILIAEMGAYQQGDIKEISSLVKPTIGIITLVGQEHVSLFGDVQTAIDTEFELAQVLPDNGLLVVNWDSKDIRQKLETRNWKLETLRYSIKDKKANVYASDIKEGLESLAFIVHNKKSHTKKKFQANLLGKHNVSNILAATAAALHLGMKLSQIAKAVATIQPLAHTMNVHHGIGNLTIIDDSYNASPQAVTSAFAHLKRYKNKKKILIMPSLIELGEQAIQFHHQLAQDAAAIFSAAIFTDRKYEQAIREGWQQGKAKNECLFFTSDQHALTNILEQLIDDKTVMLLEGRLPKDIARLLLHHFYVNNEPR